MGIESALAEQSRKIAEDTFNKMMSDVNAKWQKKLDDSDRKHNHEIDKLKESFSAIDQKNNDAVFDLDGFIKYIGCSKPYAYQLSREHTLPFSKQGGKLRILKSDVDKWLCDNKRMTSADIEGQARQHCSENSMI